MLSESLKVIMPTTYSAGSTSKGIPRVSETVGMSDAEFDRWVEKQGGQPVSKDLWEKLAKSGILPELPPRSDSTRAA
jgi:hypothetical protein